MGWWRREPSADLIGVLVEAVAKAVAQQFQSGSDLLKQQLEFSKSIGEMNTRAAARALGARGGRKSQEKKRAQRAGAAGCILCVNPMAAPLTIEQIQIHRSHQASSANGNANGNSQSQTHTEESG